MQFEINVIFNLRLSPGIEPATKGTLLQMDTTDWRAGGLQPRVLVAIASYGISNDRYLERIIREYKSMSFAVDIVVLSNIDKKLAAGIECLVGLPTKNPWSLPFAHKKLFADRLDRYDLFIYSEDDILITERNLQAWLEVNALLAEDEIAGFLRAELDSEGAQSYPDVHAYFHWDPSTVSRRGNYTLAHFTNEHAACYVLARAQLRKALNSGGFDVPPHEGKYDLLCTAATDPYTQCGLTKLIPVSHLTAFTVHHMSNRYVGKMGVTAEQLGEQTDALLRIAQNASRPKSLLPTENSPLALRLLEKLLRAGEGAGHSAHSENGAQGAFHRLRLGRDRTMAGRKRHIGDRHSS